MTRLRDRLLHECDEREGLSGEASMLDRVYHALYSHMRDRAALAAKEQPK